MVYLPVDNSSFITSCRRLEILQIRCSSHLDRQSPAFAKTCQNQTKGGIQAIQWTTQQVKINLESTSRILHGAHCGKTLNLVQKLERSEDTLYPTPRIRLPVFNSPYSTLHIRHPIFDPRIRLPEFNSPYSTPLIRLPIFDSLYLTPRIRLPVFDSPYSTPRMRLPIFDSPY